jgi:hypothetical protein
MPAKIHAITTPTANIAATPGETVLRTNSPQCLHFLASASISSAQNEHLRGPALPKAVATTLDDMGFSPRNERFFQYCRTQSGWIERDEGPLLTETVVTRHGTLSLTHGDGHLHPRQPRCAERGPDPA